MAQIDEKSRSLSAKIVYYGPGMSGKTTNLEVLERRARSGSKSHLTRLATDTSRTLFFDALSLDLGEIRGMRTRFQLYSVPGQIFYDKARQVVLRDTDGIVFVADSSRERKAANVKSLETLTRFVEEQDRRLADLSVVLQYNKRDVHDAMSIDEMNDDLNLGGWTVVEASCETEVGIEETVKSICGLVPPPARGPLPRVRPDLERFRGWRCQPTEIELIDSYEFAGARTGLRRGRRAERTRLTDVAPSINLPTDR